MRKMCVILLLCLGLSGCKAGMDCFDLASNESTEPLIHQLCSNATLRGEPNIVESEKALTQQRTADGVARNKVVETYLNSVLAKLQAEWPGKNKPCFVFLSPSSGVDAFYSEGGIFIPQGLLRDLESEDELAALLAHEYSHALLEHDANADGSKFVNYMYGLGVTYLQVKYAADKKSGGFIEQCLLNRTLSEAAQKMLIPAFSREQEDDADQLGMDLLIRADYNPIAMVHLLQRLDDWEARAREENELRKAQITEYHVVNSVGPDGKKKKEIEINYDGLFEKVKLDFKKAFASVIDHHYPASEREEKVKDYIREFYADVPRNELTEKPLKAMFSSASVKRLMHGFDRLDESNQALNAKDALNAQLLFASAYKALHKNVAYARHISFKRAAESRKLSVDKLIANCKKPDSLLGDHVSLIEYYERKSSTKAFVYAQETYIEFNETPMLLPTLIRLSKKEKNTPKVLEYMATCQMSGVEPSLVNMCNQAMAQ